MINQNHIESIFRRSREHHMMIEKEVARKHWRYFFRYLCLALVMGAGWLILLFAAAMLAVTLIR